jgi:Tol biopolymer transport system component
VYHVFLIDATGGQPRRLTNSTLSRFQSRGGQGLSASADGKTILLSGSKPSEGTHLMLLRSLPSKTTLDEGVPLGSTTATAEGRSLRRRHVSPVAVDGVNHPVIWFQLAKSGLTSIDLF